MADGKTYHEALTNAEQIIKEWLQTAKEEGSFYVHISDGTKAHDC